MKTWIALLRGVNVGGKNKLPMKMLVQELEAIGFMEARSYLQSGNVLFNSANDNSAILAAEIGEVVKNKFSFECKVIVISREELLAAAVGNPFQEAVTEGKTLHLFFLGASPLSIDENKLEALRLPSERWQIEGEVFYLHTPDGFGNSKLAMKVEKILGIPATARNWTTVSALRDLVKLTC